ncbi:EAL domain-containing protein [Salidesulfovibrio brasiliensis]|uniref:EAL domain-containing protein n=1 Tax=Salidesulfovibrio brasiliensis TaxID=221711 RepID=UPI0006D2C6A8|nr:EAL domain-containing protein [Salidesulfovibrio brasiliensis]
MKIRTTTLLILACSFGAALLAAVIISATILFPEFRRIGETKAATNAERAVNAVDNAATQLDALTRDWAWWDDTYRFAAEPYDQYITSNLVPATFEDANLHTIATFTPVGGLVHGISADENGELTHIPWELQAFIHEWASWAQNNGATGFQGIKKFGDSLYLVACEQVLTSDREGPPAGWLFMSRSIDKEWIDDLAQLTRLDITVTTPAEPLPAGHPLITLDDGVFTARTQLVDVMGNPVATITVHTPDNVTPAGLRVILATLGGLVCAIVVLGIIAHHVFRRRIGDRIETMRNQLRSIAASPKGDQIVTAHGNDELSDLGDDINAVLEELRDNERFLQKLLDSIRVGVVLVSADTRKIIQVNRHATELLGRPREELLGYSCHALICAEKSRECPVLDKDKAVDRKRCEITNAVNAKVPVLKSISSITRRGVNYLVESFMSIEELERTRRELEESEALHRTVFMNTGTATILLDRTGIIRMANSEFMTLSGAPPETVADGGTHWMEFFHPDESARMLHYHTGRRENEETVPHNYESRFITADGEIRDVTLTVGMVPGTDLSVASILDITDRKTAQKELEFKAFYDKTTELPNRQYFTDTLARVVARALHEDFGIAVIQLDIDEFKTINDSFGHDTGDRLLHDVGQRLHSALDENCMLARLGGDEFGIIVENTSSEEQASALAKRIMDCFVKPFFINNSELYLGSSMGVAIYPQDGDSARKLIRSADLAMYRSKNIGKNTYSLFSEDMNKRSRKRLETETALHRALDRRELEAWYQPKVDIGTGRITGMEALIRWRKPDGTVVPPGEFLPLAEETGLIRRLDLYIMEQACHDARRWSEETGIPRPVSVNLSARHFLREGLTERVELLLEDTGLPPALLDLEITETTLMENFDAAVKAMKRLTGLGTTFSLDDFGTGYSSLFYLKSLPFRTMKIDRTFVNMTERDPETGKALIKTMLSMAGELGLSVIAEGVETMEQLDFLQRQGCGTVQGFLFSPPVRAEDFETLLEKGFFDIHKQ